MALLSNLEKQTKFKKKKKVFDYLIFFKAISGRKIGEMGNYYPSIFVKSVQNASKTYNLYLRKICFVEKNLISLEQTYIF